MPILIPKKLAKKTNQGEIFVFELLKKLPDDCVIFHSPYINHQYPDFIIFSPRLGALVIEVKSWIFENIIDGDQSNIRIRRKCSDVNSRIDSETHPVKQARNYQLALQSLLRNHNSSKKITHSEDSNHQGKLLFPLNYCVIFTNLTNEQMMSHPIQKSAAYFPNDCTLFKDELDLFGKLSGMALEQKFKGFFKPFWQFSLSEEQKFIVRSIIVPTDVATAHIATAHIANAEPQISHAVDFILKQYFSLETEKNRKSEHMNSVTNEINLISKDTSPDIDNTNFIHQHSESINRLVSKISQGITESAAHDADELYSHSKAIKLKTEETVIKKTIHDIEKQQQALKSKLSRLASILEVEIA